MDQSDVENTTENEREPEEPPRDLPDLDVRNEDDAWVAGGRRGLYIPPKVDA